MKLLGKQVYRFDGVELDPSRGCLRRDGEELPIRQKSIQALLFLLEQRHRLVTKEELIERVWEGMAVTDDALVQLIKEIRQSLGDDHRQPRFIKTVPKAGYRFIARVEEFFPDLPTSIEIERHASVEIEYEEEIIGERELERRREGVTDRRADRKQLLSRRGPFSLSPRVALLAVAAILLVASATATYLLTRTSRRSASLAEVTLPPLPGKKPLVVMYLNNQSRSPDIEWLREGLADMLITNLSRSKFLNVLSRQQLYLLIERSGHPQTETISLDDALEIARKSRAEVAVLGSYARLGEKIRIDVQLYSVQNGQPLASESIVADKPQDILAQVDLLSLKLAAHLGAAPEVARSETKRDGLMTTNLEAYRHYSLAVEKAQALHNAEAIALLEKAIALDPKFAMAHARIGYAYAVSWGLADKGKPYLEKAFKLSDRLSEKDKLYIAAWYAIANQDYTDAIGRFREIIAAYPMETEAYWRLGRLFQGEERIDEALEVVKLGLVADAEAKELYNLLGSIYSELGRHEEAIIAHQRFVALAPNEPNAHDSLGLSYQWSGNYGEAIKEYKRALALQPEFEVAVVHLGNVYFQQGRYREAIDQYRRYIQIAPSDLERARGYGCIAQVYWKKGDLTRAERAAKKEISYQKTGMWHFVIMAIERGDLTRSEDIEKRFVDGPSARGSRGSLRHLQYLRGYLDFKSGRAAEAVAAFKEALRHRPLTWNIDSYEDGLANALLELGRLDEAIGEYERILRLNPNYPLADYHLGQAYERKGQRDRARSAYQRFLQVWKDADADVPEVMSARKALAGIGS